jgi:hypothetical protein
MKVTNFGPNGLPITLAGWSTGITSLNSNVDIIGGGPQALNFVQRITSNTSNTLLNPIVNFASGSNIAFAVQSNTLTIIGAAGGAGGGTVSAGSNSTRVSEDPSAGASSTLWSPFDHRHDGIGTITASASNTMQRGTWNIRPGAGIALSLTDTDGDGEFDTTTIVNTGSSGGGAASSDAILGQAGGNGATIPGLSGSPDIKPTSAGSGDDEFDTTDTTDPITGWTTLGTLDGLNTNSTVKSHLYLKKSATASTRIDGIYKAKSPAFTVTAKVSDHTVRATFSRVGIFIGEATPGKIETMGFVWANTTMQAEVLAMTNPTTFSSTVSGTDVRVALQVPVFLRVVVTSSTDVTYQFSIGGTMWRSVVTSRNPGFTVGSAGLFVNPQNASNDVEATFDWIRFT